MLTKTTLLLTAQNTGRIQLSNAKAVHGTFLNELSKVTPELATELHDLKEIKPFTISMLEGEHLSEGYFYFKPGDRAMFSIGMTSESVYTAVTQMAKRLSIPNAYMEIDRVQFKLEQMPILAQESQSEFKNNYLITPSKRKFTLYFESPTCFKSNGRTVLFPDSEILLKSLSKRYTALFPNEKALTKEYVTELAQKLFPSRYKLETIMLTTGRSPLIGFIGHCSYEVDKVATTEELQFIDRLIRLSTYTGIGYKTTMGFGQVRVE